MKKNFYFMNNSFIIENYDEMQPFSSFLPGIAGLHGIPLWAFYVNRGQGIASFGSRDKNGAILEYFPANNSYFNVSRLGFRTFLKIDGNVHEFFCINNENALRRMEIEPDCLRISEERPDLNIQVKVTYFNLPNEPFGALVRKVQFKDYADTERRIEILDGLPRILPAGLSHDACKAVSNLMQSWIEVKNLENRIPYFKMRASTADNPDVKSLDDGNFYLSVYNGRLLKPLVDVDNVFGHDNSLTRPLEFEKESLELLLKKKELKVNKFPCAFTPLIWDTKQEKEVQIASFIGYVERVEIINQKADAFLSKGYVEAKEQEAKNIISSLTDLVATKTAFPHFDSYLRQNYLDNVLRGGQPIIFSNAVYYVFSRKHGDLERDYNFFVTAPEYYSQGNGNFRDVCQNRRNDVLIENRIYDHNLYLFGNLIQADGYNPLGVNGTSFKLKSPVPPTFLKIIETYPELKQVLDNKFTPGMILSTLNLRATVKEQDEILNELISASDQFLEAEFGEGYWQDHWTYLLDLLDTFLKVYPDRLQEVLFRRQDYRYYHSPLTVLPRCEKHVLTADGKIRQFGATAYDQEKVRVCKLKPGTNWLSDPQGEVVLANLYSKLLVLALNKFACLDPSGIGISYEADKPGWNDAMNGLPGLFGSGVGETIELYRLVDVLIKNGRTNASEELILPIEFTKFSQEIEKAQEITDQFTYWDRTTTILETYRQDIRFFSKGTVRMNVENYQGLLEKVKKRLEVAMDKAYRLGEGIYPTYLIYEAKDYEVIYQDGKAKKNRMGLTNVRIKAFKNKVLPYFLEAPARALKTPISGLDKRKLHQAVRATELYDQKFKFYKTSVSLDECGLEIGRIRAFTKGWFERESNFLHMTYKYLFGLLEAGLYEEFYREAETNLVCFMDPVVYGRSPLENSSFLVPSNNPDPKLWGKGFVARLSGSTAEIISIWQILFFGKQPFRLEEGKLCFCLEPILKGKVFNSEGVIETTLFGQTKIVYINPRRLDTFSSEAIIEKMELDSGQDVYEIKGNKVDSALASRIRKGEFKTIKVYYK